MSGIGPPYDAAFSSTSHDQHPKREREPEDGEQSERKDEEKVKKTRQSREWANSASQVMRRLQSEEGQVRPSAAGGDQLGDSTEGCVLTLCPAWTGVYVRLQTEEEGPAEFVRSSHALKQSAPADPALHRYVKKLKETRGEPVAMRRTSSSRSISDTPAYASYPLPPHSAGWTGHLPPASSSGDYTLHDGGRITRGGSDPRIDPMWDPHPSMSMAGTSSSSHSRPSPAQFDRYFTAPFHTRPSYPDFQPPSPFISRPSSPLNPFDAILPRTLLLHVIEIYFDYVYGLVPILHRPSFMRDIHERREERPDQQEWTALVLALVGATLVQTPRAFVPLSRREVKALVERCQAESQAFLNLSFGTITVTRCIMLYFIVAWSTNSISVATGLFGANMAFSLFLRMNNEEGYKGLNPIEQQLRRRIFWLQYGGDRTVGAIDGSPMHWHEDDCADVGLPSPIDDEYITEDGYLEQPQDQTPILIGFYYGSKLFRLTGQILDKRRCDRRRPPSGPDMQKRLAEIDDLLEQVMTLMDGCPEALKLSRANGPLPGESMTNKMASPANTASTGMSDDWDAHASADVRQLFLNPRANRSVAKDTFLVQQANIYVTQYRDELLILQEQQMAQEAYPGEPLDGLLRKASLSEEEKDEVASDLLQVLQSIPIQVIAVNGMPIVNKIRYVASTLLDALQVPTRSHGTSRRTARAQTYLWDFLRILSEIEGLYSLADNADE
ncbi:hypothetical protein P7C73_g1194, partial [Tremellales sp. Uapishka_1]